MIDTIKILIPRGTEKFEHFQKITDEWGGNVGDKGKPEIVFDTYLNDNPSVCFCDEKQGQNLFNVGKLEMGFNLPKKEKLSQPMAKPKVVVLSDKVGDYLHVKWPSFGYYQMNFEQLYQRLRGHIKALDHMGVNISPKLVAQEKYESLIDGLAKSSLLMSSPENEKWVFVVPDKNGPMFELVGDFNYNYPEIQIDIQTDLTAEEIFKMFPPPYGYHDKNIKFIDYCVRVFVYTGWRDVSLRIDIRYLIPNFSHREWLMKNGRRLG
jgi:hypothetical protein